MACDPTLQIPRIDFSGLELAKLGGQQWSSVRAQVMAALDSHGVFQAAFDKVKPELLDELFGPLAKELFGVPHEAKLRNFSNKPYQGFVDGKPLFKYESLGFEVDRYDEVQAFTELIWPTGNPNFCNKVWKFAEQLSELGLIVQRMVVESLGVEKCFDPFVKSTQRSIRFSQYEAPVDEETMMAMNAHKDMITMVIICQRQREGLEVQTKSGEWIPAAPNTFTVLIGESFEAWSNGRLKAIVHRVRMTSKETRYSIGFGCTFKDGHMILAPDELVDQHHPRLYNPYEYGGYLHFRFSEAGLKLKNPLQTYCGVAGDEEGK